MQYSFDGEYFEMAKGDIYQILVFVLFAVYFLTHKKNYIKLSRRKIFMANFLSPGNGGSLGSYSVKNDFF